MDRIYCEMEEECKFNKSGMCDYDGNITINVWQRCSCYREVE